jgi:hypothetical protein
VIRDTDWPADLDARAAMDMQKAVRRTDGPRKPSSFLQECAAARRLARAQDGPSYVERIRDILVGSAQSTGVPIDRLLDGGGKRCGKITEARRTAAKRLIGELSLSSRETAEALGLNHMSVRYLLGWRRKSER